MRECKLKVVVHEFKVRLFLWILPSNEITLLSGNWNLQNQ